MNWRSSIYAHSGIRNCSRKEDLASAKRHLAFFNTTPHIVTLILGITVAWKNNSQQKGWTPVLSMTSSVVNGGAGGYWRLFFWGTVRLIAHYSIRYQSGAEGNILGPILFLLVFNVPHILAAGSLPAGAMCWEPVLQRIQQSGMMESTTYGASIIGLMVVGAMTASMIDISHYVWYGRGETHVQDIINDIMPCLLPLISFMHCVLAVREKVETGQASFGGIALVGIFRFWIGLF
ncbi:PTS mannose/fructose/sorbose transporter family subunit IID [Salmonella enterica subsp. enterica]|nr:PTS mannose/fructose/sorbose transporter family subunit IID [Salmonella enterica subsp. enterica]